MGPCVSVPACYEKWFLSKRKSPFLGSVFCFLSTTSHFCKAKEQSCGAAETTWSHPGFPTQPVGQQHFLHSGFSYASKTQTFKLWFHQEMWQASTALVGSPLPPLMNDGHSLFYMAVRAAVRPLVLGDSWTWFWFPSPFNSQFFCRSEALSGRLYLTREGE